MYLCVEPSEGRAEGRISINRGGGVFQEDRTSLRTATGLQQLKPWVSGRTYRENTGVGAQGHTVKPKCHSYYMLPYTTEKS